MGSPSGGSMSLPEQGVVLARLPLAVPMAADFGAALEIAVRYMSLLHSGLTVDFSASSAGQPTLSYRFSMDASELERGSVETFLSALIVMGGRLFRLLESAPC